MASVWRVKRSWYLRSRGGRPKSLGVIPEAQARKICAEITRRESFTARGHTAIPGLLPLREVLARWIEAKDEVRAASTVRRYKTHVAHFVRLMPREIDRPVGDLTSDGIRAFRQRRLDEGASRRNVDKDVHALGLALSWARRRVSPPLVDHDPVSAVEPFGDEPAARGAAPRGLVDELLVELRVPKAGGEQARHEFTRRLTADVVEVAYWSAMRLGELARLLVEDVDLEAWTIPIRSARNKGRAALFPIPVEARAIFKVRCALMRATVLGARAHVFGLGDGRDAYNALRQFRDDWTDPAERRRFRAAFYHSLRHAYATDLMRSRESRGVAKGLGRWRQGAVLEMYEHADLEDLRKGQARLSRFRKRARRPGGGPR